MKKPNGLILPEEIGRILQEYAKHVHEYNKTTNITGLKDSESIYNELVLGSIRPLMNIDVPRGTSFVDIGTGAGIPGIPLLVYFGGSIKGVLVDSNNKKIKFLMNVIDALGIRNSVTVLQCRVEELSKETMHRDAYDFAVARAFAHPLMAMEFGLPFVKPGGWLYIYSAATVHDRDFPENGVLCNQAGVTAQPDSTGMHKETDSGTGDLKPVIHYLQKHSINLGGHMASREEAKNLKINEGMVFIKDEPTPENYPRKHAVVKREVEKLRRM